MWIVFCRRKEQASKNEQGNYTIAFLDKYFPSSSFLMQYAIIFLYQQILTAFFCVLICWFGVKGSIYSEPSSFYTSK